MQVHSGRCVPDAGTCGSVDDGSHHRIRERQALAQKQIDFYASELKYKNPYKVEEKAEPDGPRKAVSVGLRRRSSACTAEWWKTPTRSAPLLDSRTCRRNGIKH